MLDHILVTRPLEDATAMAQLIKKKGYYVTCEPFLEVVIYEKIFDDLEQYAGVIFTSRNAVRAFCKNTSNRFLPVWTVGDATRDIALELGFTDVQSAAGNLDDLEIMIEDEVEPHEMLLYVRGKHVSRDLLRSAVHVEVLYKTEVKQKIHKETLQMIKRGDFTQILFFSTRTVQAFVEFILENELEQGLTNTKALCLGPSMVESVSVLPWKAVEIAKEPNRKSVLALLG